MAKAKKKTDSLVLALVIAAFVGVLCLFIFWPILKTLIFAATVAVVLTPYYNWLGRKMWGAEPRPWKQAITAGLMALAAVVALAVVLVVAVVIVVDNFELLFV